MILNAYFCTQKATFRNMPRVSRNGRILALARSGPFRARELGALGIPRAYLGRLVQQGKLVALGDGLYVHPRARFTEHHSLVAVLKRAPNATACLLTALQLHGLTTQVPSAIWLLIETHARAPKATATRVEIVRAGGAALTFGLEHLAAEGFQIPVTSPAKTVADCFRYRRHVGLDVALDALRGYLARGRQRGADAPRFSVEALTAASRADRVTTVIRPYLEALT